tara:strand:- start:97 stop:315 length:219 start_codon:yes stop_codon:yes gene_type:complete
MVKYNISIKYKMESKDIVCLLLLLFLIYLVMKPKSIEGLPQIQGQLQGQVDRRVNKNLFGLVPHNHSPPSSR